LREGNGLPLCNSPQIALFEPNHREYQKPWEQLCTLAIGQADVSEHQAVKHTEAKQEE